MLFAPDDNAILARIRNARSGAASAFGEDVDPTNLPRIPMVNLKHDPHYFIVIF